MGRHSSRRNRPVERDTPSIANDISSLLGPDGPTLAPLSPLSTPVTQSVLTEVEDRRQYSPYDHPRTMDGTPARVVPSPFRDVTALTHDMSFEAPRRVLVCARRKERREVLIAKKLHRKGAGGSRRRNIWSDIKC